MQNLVASWKWRQNNMIKVKIAGLIIQLNMPLKLLHDNMYDFLYKGAEDANIIWSIIFDNNYQIDEKPYISASTLNIYYKNNKVVYNYKNESNIPFMIVSDDNFEECNFYISKKYENLDKCAPMIIDNIRTCLFNVFREMFILACVCKDRLAIHSSSIIYDDKAYLFAAPSGTGKSTHASLWKDEYECEILNGDVSIAQTVIEDKDKSIIIHGCPWCGTSGIYMNISATLGGIAFLSQGKENIIYDLSSEELGIKLLENHFVPLITKKVVDACVKNINAMARIAKGYTLTCNMNKEAAKKAFEKMV